MTAKHAALRGAVVPGYLLLCIVLGGSGQAVWGNLILQLIAVALIAGAIVAPPAELPDVYYRTLIAIALAGISLILLQLVPLPPALWLRLPGREIVARGYELLEQPLPWLPVSLTPARSVASAVCFLPPFAVLVSTVKLQACRTTWGVASILVGTIVSALLGYLQVSTKSPHWYLYDITNVGSAVGFFANRDHMGTLLVVSIPFVIAVLAKGFTLPREQSLPVLLAGFSAGIVVLAGIAVNGSLAAVLLAFPAIGASVLGLRKGPRRIRRWGWIVLSCAFIVGVAFLADSSVRGKLTGTETASITGRQDIWATSLQAGTAAFPVGTGLGSYQQVYPLFEDPNLVTDVYVNHAHDDYFELFVELGLPGLLLLAGFLWWWAAATRRAWREIGTPASQAAAIASAAILAHSLVDFPLRTTAIAAVFAFCLGAMCASPRSLPETDGRIEHRRARHLVIR